jgi:hypothetical protein
MLGQPRGDRVERDLRRVEVVRDQVDVGLEVEVLNKVSVFMLLFYITSLSYMTQLHVCTYML